MRSARLPWVITNKNSGCWAPQPSERIFLGYMYAEECAFAAMKDGRCGRGFSVDYGNRGWCGCGAVAGANTDCGYTHYSRTSVTYNLKTRPMCTPCSDICVPDSESYCKLCAGNVCTAGGVCYDSTWEPHYCEGSKNVGPQRFG